MADNILLKFSQSVYRKMTGRTVTQVLDCKPTTDDHFYGLHTDILSQNAVIHL